MLLPFVCLVACSTSAAPPSVSPTTQTVRVIGAGGAGVAGSAKTAPANDLAVDTLWVGLDKIWRLLPAVYEALEIPIADFDAATNTIGNSGLKVYRRLGKTPLTKYLDCGRTQIGLSADSYDIRMSVLTRLARIDSGKTTVATNIEAVGRPMQYAGSETRCRTKGTLEDELLLNLKARLQP